MQIDFNDVGELQTEILKLDKAEERTVWITQNGEISETQPATPIKAKEYKAIWNIDRNELASIKSKRWKLNQHRDSFQYLVDSLRELGQPVKGRIYDFGNRVHMEILFKEVNLTPSDDNPVTLGIMTANTYAGGKTLYGEAYAFRQVCTNGMVVGKTMNIYVHHTKYQSNRRMYDDLVKLVVNRVPQLQQTIDESINDMLEWAHAEIIARDLYPKRYVKQIFKKLGAEREKLSRWDFYNAITNVFSTNSKVTQNARTHYITKGQVLLNNTGEQLIQAIRERETTDEE